MCVPCVRYSDYISEHFIYATEYLTGDLIFFRGTLIIYILFIHLAREWLKVMEKWKLMEREMK